MKESKNSKKKLSRQKKKERWKKNYHKNTKTLPQMGEQKK